MDGSSIPVEDVYIAVVSFDDEKFASDLEGVLSAYPHVCVCHLNYMADPDFMADTFRLILVNADASRGSPTRSAQLVRMREHLRRERGGGMLMLTRDFKAEDFLRYQEQLSADTIDVTMGADHLKNALDAFLVEKGRQLALNWRRSA